MEERWRRGGNQDRQPNATPRQNSAPREGAGNPQQSRRGGAGRGQNQNQNQGQNSSQSQSQNQSQSQTQTQTQTIAAESVSNGPASSRIEAAVTVPEEESPAVNNFNAQEVKAALKKALEPKPTVYKPAEKAPTARSGGPWASKPNAMANGKDFFVELRKQVTEVQQSGGTTLGG